MPARHDVGLGEPQRCPRRDAELGGDDVDSRHPLRDGMLDLHPRVHLEEVEAAVAVEEELDRAGVHVADGPRRGERRPDELGTQARGHGRRRRLLDDLLVPALDRAFALAQMEERAVPIAEHLNLDVPGADEELLEVDPAVAECALRLARGGRERVGQLPLAPDRPYALATPAGGSLDQHGIAEAARLPRGCARVAGRDLGAGHAGNTGALDRGAGRELVPHRRDRRGGRSDPR